MNATVVDLSARLAISSTPYKFIRLLGSGASSEVFEVADAEGARWALKLLRATATGKRDSQARFLREAWALAHIEHPNLVPVVDAGSASGERPYYVMPLLEGETLRDRVRRAGPLRPSDASAIMVDVLGALETAHRAGIVHRDVKPANIFLTERAAILLDFGVAKLLRPAPNDFATAPDRVVGTPRYLAPEQVLGCEVDARTDVYAAGLVLFEMLTGRDPFGARSSNEQLRARVLGVPARVREHALVTAELDMIVARAIERTPDYRWASAGEFRCALARARARYLRAPDMRARASCRFGGRLEREVADKVARKM
ncbi:MAG TPA: serine/threonine-protein kinase [Byssovorax sp.]|jgi:serine/threonine-protein kinase